MKLTANIVSSIFMNCLFQEGEDTSNAVIVEGFQNKIGFNPEKIEKYRDDIIELANELPENFQASSEGGGNSFLNAIEDKHGNQWGEHQRVDQLVCLGQATGVIRYLAPRPMWSMLPGGMPYFQVIDPQKMREEKIDNILDKDE